MSIRRFERFHVGPLAILLTLAALLLLMVGVAHGAACSETWVGGSGTWNTASDWSGGVVPGQSDTACITAPGTYTVTLTDYSSVGGASIAGLVLGAGSGSGTQTLDVEGTAGVSNSNETNNFTNLSTSGDASITAGGELVLDATSSGTGNGGPDGGAANLIVGGTVTNAGTLVSEVSDTQWENSFQTTLVNQSGGSVEISSGTTVMQGGSFSATNDGTWTVDPNATFAIIAAGTFTNDGTFTNNGTTTGSSNGNNNVVWNQNGGSAGGNNPIQLSSGATLNDSAGPGSFLLLQSDNVTGTIPSGQTIELQGSGGNSSYLELPNNTPVTNDGTVIFDAPGTGTSSGGPSVLGGGSGTFDNDGTVMFTNEDSAYSNSIQATLVNESDGTVEMSSGTTNMQGGSFSVTNDGTFTVDPDATFAILYAGTFTNDGAFTDNGTMTATANGNGGSVWNQVGGSVGGSSAPELLSGVWLNDSGGTGTFDCTGGGSNELNGTIPAGQTIDVQAQGETLYLGPSSGTDFENRGTIDLTDSDGNGGAGNATLSVDNNGTLTNDGTISSTQGSFGDGAATGTISGNLTNSSAGTIEVQDSLNQINGEITNAGAVDVAAGDSFIANDQYSQSAGDTQLSSNAALVASGGVTLTGGTLGGSGTVTGNVTNGGTVSPSPSPATLTISGNYTEQSSGLLTAEVTSSGVDTLSVGGTASLAGTLQVSTASGFSPPVGQVYKPVVASAVSGTFDTVAGLSSGPYSLAYDQADVALTALSPPATPPATTLPSLAVGNVTVPAPSGAPGTASFTVSLSSASSSTVTVDYATSSGTAFSGTDFLPTTGTLTFTPGQTSATVTVTVEPPGTAGADRTFFLDLSNASGATISQSRGTCTIILGASLSSITPTSGGTGGTVDFTLSGAGLAGATSVKLARTGESDISATNLASTPDGLTATGTFDLTGAARGVWDVVVQRADGKTVTLPGAFTVQAETLPDVSVSLSGLQTARPDGPWNGLLEYTNSGNVNGYGTVVEISAGAQVTAPGADGVSNTVDGDVDQVTLMIPEVAGGSSGAIPVSFTFPNWHPHSWVNLEAMVENEGSTTPLAPQPTLTLDGPTVDTASHWGGTVTLTDGSDTGTVSFDARVGRLPGSTPADGSVTGTSTPDGGGTLTLDEPFTDTLCSTSGPEAQFMPWSCQQPPAPGATYTDPDAGIPYETGEPAVLYASQREAAQAHAASPVVVKINGVSITVHDAAEGAKTLYELYEIHEGVEQSEARTHQLACLKENGYISEEQFNRLSSDAGFGWMKKTWGLLVGHFFLVPGLLVSNIPDPYDQNLATTLMANDAGSLAAGGSLASLTAQGITKHGLSATTNSSWTGLLTADPVFTALKVAEVCPPTEKKQEVPPPLPVEVVTSGDPNDIQGPVGAGRRHYVRDGQKMQYTVSFQNKATADAPAQTVVVTDHLSSSVYKLRTFALGPIRIGDKVATPPAGVQSWHTDIDMRPEVDVIASVDAVLDPSTGVVTWRFTSIDPATGQPLSNPDLGFLLQDKQPPEGEGTVGFTVTSRSGLKTKRRVTDSASIVFDTNAAITTPTWTNTIDRTRPKSRLERVRSAVLRLRTSKKTSTRIKRRPAIALRWKASDAGSGISSFGLFASAKGQKLKLIGVLKGARRSELVQCVAGKTYRFKLVAVSMVGLRQARAIVSPTVRCKSV